MVSGLMSHVWPSVTVVGVGKGSRIGESTIRTEVVKEERNKNGDY